VFGTIVVVDGEEPTNGGVPPGHSLSSTKQLTRGVPLSCIEVLGQTILKVLTGDLQRAGANPISLVIESSAVEMAEREVDRNGEIRVTRAEDVWYEAALKAVEYQKAGVTTTLLMSLNAYFELDLSDILQSHGEMRGRTMRGFDSEGPLNLWCIASGFATPARVLAELRMEQVAAYEIRGYVNRLNDPGCLRRLAIDVFHSRCRLRPNGREVQPGVWIANGAEVDQRASLQGPVFIGCHTKVAEQCLIEQCSNVERDCEVDFGTTVSDSYVMSNSYVGMGLDMSHSIVSGSNVMNLEHGVMLKVSDPSVLREHKVPSTLRNRMDPRRPRVDGMLFSPAEENAG